jgi:hypothetical protein
MKFVALFQMKPGVSQAKVAEAVARRVEYKFPEGMQLIHEYWSPTPPNVVSIFEAKDVSSLMMNSINWTDVFDVQVIPVVDFEEGAKKLSTMFARK